jgi:OOP family OmpA-OmpF porin
MSSRMRVSACALLVLWAGAANADDQGFYFGASGGLAKYEGDEPQGLSDLIPDDEASVWAVSGGYRINRYFAVEVGYLNLGTLEGPTRREGSPHPGGSSLVQRELQTTGPAITAIGTLPLSESWKAYMRAGVLLADSELNQRSNGAPSSFSFDSEAPTLGAGVQYDCKAHWSARLEFEHWFDIGDDVGLQAEVNALSLAVLYRL